MDSKCQILKGYSAFLYSASLYHLSDLQNRICQHEPKATQYLKFYDIFAFDAIWNDAGFFKDFTFLIYRVFVKWEIHLFRNFKI